jgi:hypothetical protein
LRILLGFFQVFYFMQFLEISWDLGILGFSKILGIFPKIFLCTKIFRVIYPSKVVMHSE